MLYIVKSNILKDHVFYEPGSEIELDDATAARISHAIEGPIAAPVEEPIILAGDGYAVKKLWIDGKEVDPNEHVIDLRADPEPAPIAYGRQIKRRK